VAAGFILNRTQESETGIPVLRIVARIRNEPVTNRRLDRRPHVENFRCCRCRRKAGGRARQVPESHNGAADDRRRKRDPVGLLDCACQSAVGGSHCAGNRGRANRQLQNGGVPECGHRACRPFRWSDSFTFVSAQLDAPRPATRRKAALFLKKHLGRRQSSDGKEKAGALG